MMPSRRAGLDPRTQAAVTIAWVILANKPLYPVYVWWLVGNGVIASLATMIAVPFYLFIPLMATRRSLLARVLLPLVGTVDTLFETKLFGTGSGTEIFLAACIMLVALGFTATEKWWQRGMAILVFGTFLIARTAIGPPLHLWSETDLNALLHLNAFAVASLMTFIALRYAGIADGKAPDVT